jgi:hypothetical protein
VVALTRHGTWVMAIGQHLRGKAHTSKAGVPGFCGLLPNDAGITPEVTEAILAAKPGAPAPLTAAGKNKEKEAAAARVQAVGMSRETEDFVRTALARSASMDDMKTPEKGQRGGRGGAGGSGLHKSASSSAGFGSPEPGFGRGGRGGRGGGGGGGEGRGGGGRADSGRASAISGQSPGSSPGLKPPLAPREDGSTTMEAPPAPPGLGPPAAPPGAEADNWRAEKARKASGSDLSSLAEAIAEIPMEEPIVEKSSFTPGHRRTRSNVPLRVPPLLEPLGGPLAEERAKLPVHAFKQQILQVTERDNVTVVVNRCNPCASFDSA